MAIDNVILVSQMTGYLVSWLLTVIFITPVSYNYWQFKGHCLLFTSGDWKEEDGQFLPLWSSVAYCDVILSVGTIILLVSTYKLVVTVQFLRKKTDSTFLAAFMDVIFCIVVTMLLLAMALLVTVGYKVWCLGILKRFENCRDAASNKIDKADGIDTSGFYLQWGTAQFAIWAMWTCWVGLTMCAIMKVCKYHQEENIRVSMMRERQRQRMLNGASGSPAKPLCF